MKKLMLVAVVALMGVMSLSAGQLSGIVVVETNNFIPSSSSIDMEKFNKPISLLPNNSVLKRVHIDPDQFVEVIETIIDNRPTDIQLPFYHSSPFHL